MGRRGPKGRPNHLKIAQGVREDRINRDEPTPAEADTTGDDWLEPPVELTEAAQQIWDRLVPDLIAQRVMTAWDVDQFAMFCTAVSVYWDAHEQMGGKLTTLGANDNPIKSPYWQIMRDAQTMMTAIGSRYGLSPADRASLKVGAEEEKPTGAGRLLG